jgi:hypothetical protein
MARQKFAHISGAIDEMADYLEEELAAGLTPAQKADCQRFLADSGRVQLAQLQSVFGQLDEAAREVGGGLQEVDSQAKTFAEHAMRSGDAALDGRIIERTVRSIRAVLAVIDQTVGNVRTVGQLVVKLKATFHDCTSQILGLALRLRMVALNAQIFAAHVDAGAALEVVAKNTRTIAEEAMRQLDEISLRVTELVDLLVDLEQRLGDHGELAAMERDLLAREAGESEQKLGDLEKDLRNAIAAIGPLERELSNAVRRTTESIRFPAAVAEASARSTTFFKAVILQHSSMSLDAGREFHHKVRELKSKYTMAHERDVHESVFETTQTLMPHGQAQEEAPVPLEEGAEGCSGGSAIPALAAIREIQREVQAEVDDDKLADNVELF